MIQLKGREKLGYRDRKKGMSLSMFGEPLNNRLKKGSSHFSTDPRLSHVYSSRHGKREMKPNIGH